MDVLIKKLRPEFIRIAKNKNPAGHYQVADMIDFDLGKRYDVLVSLFSSIGSSKRYKVFVER